MLQVAEIMKSGFQNVSWHMDYLMSMKKISLLTRKLARKRGEKKKKVSSPGLLSLNL